MAKPGIAVSVSPNGAAALSREFRPSFQWPSRSTGGEAHIMAMNQENLLNSASEESRQILRNLEQSLTSFLRQSVTFLFFEFKQEFIQDPDAKGIKTFVETNDVYPQAQDALQNNPIVDSFELDADGKKVAHSDIFENYDTLHPELRTYRKNDVCDRQLKFNALACQICTACDMFYLLKAYFSQPASPDNITTTLISCWMCFSGIMFVPQSQDQGQKCAVFLGQFVADSREKRSLKKMARKTYGVTERGYRNFFRSMSEVLPILTANCSVIYPDHHQKAEFENAISGAKEMFQAPLDASEISVSLTVGSRLARSLPTVKISDLIFIISEFANLKESSRKELLEALDIIQDLADRLEDCPSRKEGRAT